jgi:hypothetical protein
MNNLDSYMAYNPDEGVGTLSLGLYDVDPAQEDNTKLSMALGMIDKALSADYKQGSSSETLSNESRSYYYSRGKLILASLNVEYIEPETGVKITGGGW